EVIRQQRLDGQPLAIGEFVAHEIRLESFSSKPAAMAQTRSRMSASRGHYAYRSSAMHKVGPGEATSTRGFVDRGRPTKRTSFTRSHKPEIRTKRESTAKSSAKHREMRSRQRGPDENRRATSRVSH